MWAFTWKRHQRSLASPPGSIEVKAFVVLGPGFLIVTVLGIAHLAERLVQDLEAGLALFIKACMIVAAQSVQCIFGPNAAFWFQENYLVACLVGCCFQVPKELRRRAASLYIDQSDPVSFLERALASICLT
jgi:hypothetical protein